MSEPRASRNGLVEMKHLSFNSSLQTYIYHALHYRIEQSKGKTRAEDFFSILA